MSLSGSKKWVNVCKSKSSHGSRKREACHRDIEQHEIKKKRKEKQNLKNKNWMLSEHPNNNTKCCLIT